MLASISNDHYERIEQGRGTQPSASTLGSIARALRLTLDERDHAYRLARQQPPEQHQSFGYAEPGLMRVLDAIAPTVPALITDELHEVIAQNPLNVALLGPLATADGRQRNFLWRWFTDPDLRSRYVPEQHDVLGREYVADLRAASSRRGADAAVRSLVEELGAVSQEFRAIWAQQEVAVRRTTRKVLSHPEAGQLDMRCDVVVSPPSGQRLILFRPQPGAHAAERLEMLGVIGTETFSH